MIKTMTHIFRCFPFRRRRRFPLHRNMDDNQNIDDACKALAHVSISTKPNIKYTPMPNPRSVYVPLQSLDKKTIDSIVLTVEQSTAKHWTHSQRTLLAFLLAINDRLNEIENNKDSKKKFEQSIAAKVRQWLREEDQTGNVTDIDWNELQTKYNHMTREQNDGMATRYFGMDKYEPYYEMTIENVSEFRSEDN